MSIIVDDESISSDNIVLMKVIAGIWENRASQSGLETRAVRGSGILNLSLHKLKSNAWQTNNNEDRKEDKCQMYLLFTPSEII